MEMEIAGNDGNARERENEKEGTSGRVLSAA